jgi:GNAT superfamily N-acetyltransferase
MQIELKIWQPKDKAVVDEFVKLISTVLMPKQYNQKLFLWKHKNNFWGPSIIAYAVNEGRVIAIRAFWRHQLSYNGRCLLGFQPCDTATHPDFQRQGMFTTLTHLALEEAEKQGASLIFNFPNSNSKIGNLKMGWQDIGGALTLLKPLKPIKTLLYFTSHLKTISSFIPDQKSSTAKTPRFDNILVSDGRLGEGVIAGKRNPDMLAWRFANHPNFNYELIKGDGTDTIVKLGVRGSLRELSILDILTDSDVPSKDQIVQLLTIIKSHYKADIVTMVLTSGHPLVKSLQRCGFWKAPNRMNFTARPVGKLKNEILKSQWALTAGDVDTL